MKAYYLTAVAFAADAWQPAIAPIVDSRAGKWAVCWQDGLTAPSWMIVAVSDRLARGRPRDGAIHTLCKTSAIHLGDDLRSALNRMRERAETRGAVMVDQRVGDE